MRTELKALEALEEIAATANQFVSFENLPGNTALFQLKGNWHNEYLKKLFSKPLPKDQLVKICNKNLINYCILSKVPKYDEAGNPASGIIQVMYDWQHIMRKN